MRTAILALLSLGLGPPQAVLDLDRSIQKRFLDGESFGMKRILPFDRHGVRQFQPETAEELQTVNQLDREGYELGFFLAGRAILTTPEAFVNPVRLGVQGPAYITHKLKASDLPSRDELLPLARAALKSFEHGEGYSTEKDGWTVLLRPLRAANNGCIACHKTLDPNVKVGDAAGVAMYVYRKNP